MYICDFIIVHVGERVFLSYGVGVGVGVGVGQGVGVGHNHCSLVSLVKIVKIETFVA